MHIHDQTSLWRVDQKAVVLVASHTVRVPCAKVGQRLQHQLAFLYQGKRMGFFGEILKNFH